MIVSPLKPELKHGPPREKTTGVVLHATAGGSLSGAIATLREKGFAYHYLIDKRGLVTKCCPSTAKASHAGESHGWDGDFCNRYSIGVSFVNWDTKEDKITPSQVAACVELLKTLRSTFPDLKYVSTHYGVSYPRKQDPVSCDAKAIAESAGLEYWPGRRKW